MATSCTTVELAYDIERTQVTVLLGGVESSHLNLLDPADLTFEYMQHMQAVIRAAFPPAGPGGAPRLRALHLGAAGCAMARAIEAEWPDSRQLAVEIDGLLAQYMREWFELPRAPRLRIRVGDARAAVDSPGPARYEVVLRDAFADRVVPQHLRTVEFTRAVAARLTEDGIYLANVADRPPLPVARREAATLAAVFAHVGIVAEPAILRGRRYGNVVLVGSHRPLPDTAARLLRSMPVAARLVTGPQALDFLAGHRPFEDPPAP
ncbi:spermidine synthase [Pseudactinotalea sp. HY158]|uniref:spermidine synthase n=1 Tax=Pseudactinotalea sp. HY158 TaxID=2654547 RepID=UPI00129CCE57|nr:fused MFS/spermidine synthase [Pseudactinotalea sp. HY158]QGH69843.1 spermidine synthase [Pseudactinotalea sp. HY158]